MSTNWFNRVAAYLDGLEECIAAIDGNVAQMKVDTMSSEQPAVDRQRDLLVGLLEELESKIRMRADLLCASDAPNLGLTLTSKLRENGQPELGDRCQSLSEQISLTHHRCVSLFVCQFHLADFGNYLMRLFAGDGGADTYGAKPTAPSGGALFNEAA